MTDLLNVTLNGQSKLIEREVVERQLAKALAHIEAHPTDRREQYEALVASCRAALAA